MYAFIRWWARVFLRLYFRKIIVYGRDRVPLKGPLILASNHPSAFMEASILSTVMPRHIHFLVRGDMFNPRFHWLFKWTKQIPIYRQKDGIANLRKNAATFDLTYRKLAEGESVLIFPEAKTIWEKRMRPIQRGTAHLAFGTLPYIQDGSPLMIQPVGVNFTDPRQPGTDVVVQFGEPFATRQAVRENRSAIEDFTSMLSDSMSPLIIQVDEDLEKNYDVASSVYFRMIHDNVHGVNALKDLHAIAARINDRSALNLMTDQTDQVFKSLQEQKLPEAVYFPDLIVLNKTGLFTMAVLKSIWLLAGGWLWRGTRGIIFSKIKKDTFQGPTTLGVFMLVMPLVTLLLTLFFLIMDIPLYFVLLWLLVMAAGALIRPPVHVILRLLAMNGKEKNKMKNGILNLRQEIEYILK